MAADDQRPQPVVLRIKLRYDDVETMVQRFAPNVGKSGLFLPTKQMQPVGTEVKFELRIANDTPVLVGLGKVKAAKAPDPANPKAAFGLAIELMRVTREGREVIIRMIERRRAMGLADVTIPMPEDIETAKRADVETQPRADAAAVMIPPAPQPDSAPILSAPPPISKPAAAPRGFANAPIAKPGAPTTPPDALLTSARPSSGSLPAVRPERPSAAVLAPEPLRAKRPRLADVIAQAERSVPVVAPHAELDESVDIERAFARARALAGGDMDAELAALRETSAAPLAEISIEAASAELARQLGGAAVGKRTRVAVPARGTSESVVAAPVPALASASSQISLPELDIATAVEPQLEEAPVAEPPPDPDQIRREFVRLATASSEMDRLAAEAAVGIASARGEAAVAIETPDEPPAAPPVVIARPRTAPPALIVEEDHELMSFDRALDAARVHTGVATQAAPEHTIDEIDPGEIEELPGESTQVGQHPDPRVGLAEPVALHLEHSIDRHLDDAEHDNDELARSIQAAATQYEAELADVPEAQAVPVDDEFVEEEISDLDVLAEADADDADLMGASGERDSQDAAPAYVPQVEQYSHDHPAVDPAYAAQEPAYAHDPAYADSNPAQYADAGQDPAYTHDPAQYADPNADANVASDPAPYADANVANDPAYQYADPNAAHDPYAPADPAYAAQYADTHDPYGEAAQDPAYVHDAAASDPIYGLDDEQEAQQQHGYTGPMPQRSQPGAYTAQEDRGYNSRGRSAPDPASYEQSQNEYDPAYAEEAAYADQVAREAPRRYAASEVDDVTRPGEVPLPTDTYRRRIPNRAATPTGDRDFDFAAQLDLDDESAPPSPYPGGYDIPSEYTFAEKIPIPHTPGLDEALEFDEPHQFATNTPAPPTPRSGSYPRPPSHQRRASSAARQESDYDRSEASVDFDEPHGFVGGEQPIDDLENALSTLDVDLDHLEVPPPEPRARQPRARRDSGRSARPLPGMPPERESSQLDPPTVRPANDLRPPPRPTSRNVVQKTPTPQPKPAPRPAAKSAAPPIPTKKSAPAPASKPIPRAASEDDGVLIDFDDEDE